jgi:DNA-binding NtrC family response regulator
MVEHANGTKQINVQVATAGEPAAVLPESGTLIYVVDDAPMVGDLVATVLEMAGYQIGLFRKPAEAMKAFIAANPRPVLLLTDFNMDGLNGMELIEQCKRVQPTLKTILCSGTVGMEITQRYLIKPDHFIPKPFEPLNNLVDTVRLILAR